MNNDDLVGICNAEFGEGKSFNAMRQVPCPCCGIITTRMWYNPDDNRDELEAKCQRCGATFSQEKWTLWCKVVEIERESGILGE